MDFQPRQELLESFEKIYVDAAAVESKLAQRAFALFPKSKIEVVQEQPWSHIKRGLTAEEFNRSKRNLFLTPFKGQFFKRCPGATQKKVLNCCNYHVLNLGSQCNMNCSYCYLQSYLNTPIMKMYTNLDQALAELQEMAQDHGHLPFRVGTGEVIDSLSLDELTLFSRDLIPFFERYPKWTLEFKTKSDRVEQFLDLGPSPNTVVSWSVNASAVIDHEEHGTARLPDRLLAAQKCREKGFSVAFHLDPLIWHPNWKESYADLVDQIVSRFSPDDINVISLGTLRFQPEQRHMMKQRFGMKSWVTQAEMFPSEGAKLRYDASLRQEMLKFVHSRFKSHSDKWRIFLCMETPETWISALESQPLQKPELQELFRPLPKVDAPTV
ncbi:MAG: radical SAM protein [Bdellovibrionales bacterium]